MRAHNLSPLQNENRVVEIDIIRGFALFGVLLVNLTMIDATMYSYVPSAFEYSDPLTRFSALLIHLFAVGKFYSLFSMLFGLGFFYFMNKTDGSPISGRLYVRRLIALFFFGILHLVCVWYGDILHVYAITGFVLLRNRNRSSESLLKISILLFLLSTAIFVMFQADGGNSQNGMFTALQKAEIAYTQTSYIGMLTYRLTNELPMIAFNFLAVLPKILSLFMFGYYIGKSRMFVSIDSNLEHIKFIWRISGAVALLSAVGYSVLTINETFIAGAVVFDELLTISGALFYATSLIILYQNPVFKKVISPLKYSGKMALSNYLMQTICFTTLIYGYGAGLFGKIPYWAYFPIATLFYMGQIVISKWWLAHHKFGPMEYVWRRFTYSQSR